ncbi:MAG: hypothetical protein JWN67_2235 [Actinomycetia bacterium]|nr:hypothetical protein [Actinomycetes bacterium]
MAVLLRSTRKAGFAALAACIAVLGLTVTPAHAALGSAQPLAKVLNATSAVNPTTPIWQIDVTFTLGGVISCPADIHYIIQGSAEKATVCTSGQTAPTTLKVRRPVFSSGTSGISTLTPGGTASVRAMIRSAGADVDNDLIGAPAFNVNVPPAPVWVGVGDGYTSQLLQDPDGCTLPDDCYRPNDPTVSWVTLAVQQLNLQFSPPTNPSDPSRDWSLKPAIIATSDTSAAGIAAQQAQMVAALQAHAGSWNWVGMSAGLVDSGIPAALQAYYTANGYDPGPLPWEAVDPSECPDFSNVIPTVQAQGAAMKASLQVAAGAALAADPSVRVIQVLYPYLTETSQVIESALPGDRTSYPNPCAVANGNNPANRDVIDALDSAINIDTTPGDNVFSLDLRNTFTDLPTGNLMYIEAGPDDDPGSGGYQRIENFLQLSRPFGYPYPSPQGAGTVAEGVINLVFGQASDETPPVVTGFPLASPVPGSFWYNRPLDIQWLAFDPSPGTGLDPTKGTWPTSSRAASEGQLTWQSPYEAWDLAGNHALGQLSLSTDFSPPTITVTPDRAPNSRNWYNADVNLSWNFVTDAKAGVNVVSGPDLTTRYGPYPVTLSGANLSHTNPLNTMCDVAKNCIQATGKVNVDKVKPIVTPIVTGTLVNGWYKGSVTVDWTAVDGGGSTLLTGGPYASTTVTTGGTTVVSSPSICDRADNCTVATQSVQVDNAPPVIAIAGATQGQEYTSANMPTAITCQALDVLSGVNGSCVVTVATSALPNGVRYTYTATATDLVGNTSTTTLSFDVIGASVAPPSIVGVPDRAPDANGWYNHPVTIHWVVTAQPGTTVRTDWPDTVVGTQGQNKAIASPQVCDQFGNCASTTYTVSTDFTGPSVTVSPDRSANLAGWYNAPVTVSWAFTGDNLSGANTATQAAPRTVQGNITAVGQSNAAGTMCDLAGNCTTATLPLSIDTVAPTVTANPTSSSPATNGWYRTGVTINWATGDTGGSGLNPLTASPLPGAALLSGANQTFTTPPVCDLAGNCATGTATVNLDLMDPTVSVGGVTAGKTYTAANRPTATCSAVDQTSLSGLDGTCTLSTTKVALPAYGPPGYTYTTKATATDKAGNSATKTVIYVVYEITPKDSGHMSGSGTVGSGTNAVSANLSIRCTARPDTLKVSWTEKVGSKTKTRTFSMTEQTSSYCWNDPGYQGGTSNTSFDSLTGTGTGRLDGCGYATVEYTFTDQGKTGTGDTIRIVIKDSAGNVLVTVAGKINANGNIVANADSNNGNYDSDGYDGAGYDHNGYDHDGYDHNGYDHSGYDHNGCDKYGRSRFGGGTGYTKPDYDGSGYDRSGYDRSGYDHNGYDRSGYDKDGCNRQGYDRHGVKRKSTSSGSSSSSRGTSSSHRSNVNRSSHH